MSLFLEILSWVLLVGGSLLITIGGIGLLRLPDFYSRIHAAGITDTLGAWLILLGLMCHAESTVVLTKLILVLVFLAITSPTSSHALAKAAWIRGLRPWTRTREEDAGK